MTSSSYEEEDETIYAPLWTVVSVNVVLCVVTVVGNAMVIAAYIRDEKIRKTVAYTLILNLSITDLLVGLFIFPINTVWWIQDSWMLGAIVCKLWLVLDYSVLMMSTFTIVFISLDRYWLLTKGLDYQRFQTFRQVIVILSLAWATTLLLYFSIAFLYPTIIVEENSELEECELEVVASTWFNFFELIVQFIIPFAALLFLNYQVYSNIRERARGMVSVRYESSVSDASNNVLKERCRTVNGESSNGSQSYAYVNENIELKEKEPESSNSISFTSVENENHNGETTSDHSDEKEEHTHPPPAPPPPPPSPPPPKSVTYAAVVTNIDGPNEVDCAPPGVKRQPPVVIERRKSLLKREKSEFRRHRKAAITLGVLVAVFCVCWLPYYICAVIRSFDEDLINDRVWEIVSYFQWCNSTINPFIYGFTNLLFRRNFVKFMHIDKCIKNSQLTSAGSSNN